VSTQAARQHEGDDRPELRRSPWPRDANAPFPRRPLSRLVRGPLVLIAEDTFDTRELYELYLTRHGFRVQTVVDGEAAVETALESSPDVIVLDLSMPRVDGIAATKRLKQDARTRDIPIIILTGYPHKAIQQGALEAGADTFLTKPCLPEDLEQQVRKLLTSTPKRMS
jgi:two-component system cell cycle response regulator DivK